MTIPQLDPLLAHPLMGSVKSGAILVVWTLEKDGRYTDHWEARRFDDAESRVTAWTGALTHYEQLLEERAVYSVSIALTLQSSDY